MPVHRGMESTHRPCGWLPIPGSFGGTTAKRDRVHEVERGTWRYVSCTEMFGESSALFRSPNSVAVCTPCSLITFSFVSAYQVGRFLCSPPPPLLPSSRTTSWWSATSGVGQVNVRCGPRTPSPTDYLFQSLGRFILSIGLTFAGNGF